mmetsp:Transcript_4345/g.13139  ORF Transcript_4345/g.13139 Transcript_4345/m.13139 type:complete len:510 (+) Transcript_4345:57-1586(+)
MAVALLHPVVVVVVLVVALVGLSAGRPQFSDVSRRVGITGERKLKYFGACIADIDRDGRYDLVLTNHNLDPVDWYWSKGRSSFSKSSASKLKFADFHGVAAGDLNGDGDLDVIVTIGGSRGRRPAKPMIVETKRRRKLSTNRGGKFGLGTHGFRGRSPRFIDMDGDGDLDILYVNAKPFRGRKYPHHVVYENLGRGRFRRRPGLTFGGVRAKWLTLIDVNGDGHMDILFMSWYFVQLWVWRGPFRYRNESWRIPGAHKMRFVRCGAEFDMDNDGDFDLYLTRMMLTLKLSQKRRDILLENRGGVFRRRGKFPRTDHSHVTAADLDNDGRMDLYLTRWGTRNVRKPDVMLLNVGGGRFKRRKVRSPLPWRSYGQHGDSGDAFDYDMDGRVDILSGNFNGKWRLLRNTSPRKGRHYFIVRVGRPVGGIINPSIDSTALGAVVQLDLGRKRLTRRVGSAGESHSQQYLDTLHFGLGRKSIVHRIIVKYPTGLRQVRRRAVRADRVVTFGRYV